MMNKMILIAMLFSSFSSFGQAKGIDPSIWYVDSVRPVSADDLTLEMIGALALVQEEDRPAYLMIENQTISLLNPSKSTLKSSKCAIQPSNKNTTFRIDVDGQFGFLQILDKKRATLTLGGAVYYLECTQ